MESSKALLQQICLVFARWEEFSIRPGADVGDLQIA